MMDFRDAEPEDAWHPDDDPRVQLEQLARRAAVLGSFRRLPGDTVAELLADLEDRLAELRQRERDFTPEQVARLRWLIEDVLHVRARVT